MIVSESTGGTPRESRSGIVLLTAIACSLGVAGMFTGAFARGAEPQQQTPSEDAADRPAAEATADTETAEPPTVAGSRDLLELYGVDDSHFELLFDGVPWQAGENETLLKVMYRLHRDFRLMDVERWSRGGPDPAELAEDPKAYRGEIFHLKGRVASVTVCRPEEPEVRERFELQQYYRCDFLLDRQQPAVLFAWKIPSAWKTGESIDERAGAFGVFLKLGSEDPKRPLPVFVAARVAWYPETPLGSLGMDEGLFDDMLPEEPQPGQDTGPAPQPSLKDLRLTGRDRECFYQLLAAVGRAKPGELQKQANRELKRLGKKSFPVVPLFNRPLEQRGRLVALQGTTRRIERVRVGDEDILARFGINQYYQVFLFTEDSQSNPLVFCVRELPPGMPTGEDPRYGEFVSVAGFYFKKWAYRTPRPDETSPADEQWQLAPLLIGRELVWYPTEKPAVNPFIGAIAAGLFVLALLGVWLALWRYSRGDKRFRDATIAKQFAMDSGISLDQLGLDADGTPDFSGLEQADRADADDSGRPPSTEESEPR